MPQGYIIGVEFKYVALLVRTVLLALILVPNLGIIDKINTLVFKQDKHRKKLKKTLQHLYRQLKEKVYKI